MAIEVEGYWDTGVWGMHADDVLPRWGITMGLQARAQCLIFSSGPCMAR